MGAVHYLLDHIITTVAADSTTLKPANVWCGLFSGITDRGVNTLLANLVLPTGGLGALVSPTTWGTPYHLNDGSAVADGEPCVFTLGGGDTPTTCIGYYLSDDSVAAAGDLLLYNYFPAPIPVPDVHSPITVVPRITVPAVAVWDVSEVWDG